MIRSLARVRNGRSAMNDRLSLRTLTNAGNGFFFLVKQIVHCVQLVSRILCRNTHDFLVQTSTIAWVPSVCSARRASTVWRHTRVTAQLDILANTANRVRECYRYLSDNPLSQELFTIHNTCFQCCYASLRACWLLEQGLKICNAPTRF